MPEKVAGLGGYGLELVAQQSLTTEPNTSNIKYLRTKRDKMAHTMKGSELPPEAPRGE